MPANAAKARVSMIIQASGEDIISAFISPETLTQFWLFSSSAPLSVGVAVHWRFMVAGAEARTTATRIEPGRRVSWAWDDGSTVDVEAEGIEGGSAVTIINAGFHGTADEVVEAALNATEGFALVLADLKTVLEQGSSAHLVRDKARLIELRK